MSLSKSKIRDIPTDAVILTEYEALQYQTDIIHNWNNEWDVFGFKYAALGVAVGAFFTGMYVHTHYRRKLKLFHLGKLSTYLPTCAIPCALSYFFHLQLIVPDLILQKSCPVCVEMRAAAIQATVGCILPTILAPLSSFAVANKFATYDIPYLHKEPLKVLEIYKKITKPIANILFAILVGNVLIASAVTYIEAKSIAKVKFKLAQIDNEARQALEME